MRRFFSILEGPGKGTEKDLDKSYMLIGRSSVADLQIEGDDLLVSRRHIEVRLKDDSVFVKDISSKGSLLNGQRLKGEVSLNSGDILDLGNSKLQYQEFDAGEPPSDQTQSKPATALPPDRTRVPDDRTRLADDRTRLAERTRVPDDRTRLAGSAAPSHSRDEEPRDDATHAALEDQTRMLNPVELPGWKSPVRPKSGARPVVWVGLLAVLAIGGAAAYWFLGNNDGAAGGDGAEFKDPGFGLTVRFPGDWSRLSSKPEMVSFGLGKEGEAEWARVHIYSDKNPQNSVTGLRGGFAEYKEVLKKQFKEFELTGSQRRLVNDIEVVFFGFGTPELEGVGLYSLNADNRVVIECFSPRKNHQRFAAAFDSIFKSCRFSSSEPQQFIDFPLPDANMKRLALASPAELNRQVQEYQRRAEALLASKDVRPDNLFRSVNAYGQALQLSIAGPQPLASYPSLAHGLQRATQLYGQAVDRQRFEINRALKAKDAKTAYWSALRLMQMVPDKAAPAHLEAFKVTRSLEAAK